MESPLIFKKICAIQSEIKCISKKEKNVKQGYNFRGIDVIYNELHDIFVKHSVFSTTEVLEDKHEERKSKSGGVLIYRILKIKYTFYAEDGSNIFSIVIGEGMDSGDKASNKAMAVGHKYALLQLLIIPTQEPKDPDYDTPDVLPKTVDLLTLDQVTEIQDVIKETNTDVMKYLDFLNKSYQKKYKEIADIEQKHYAITLKLLKQKQKK